MACTCNAQFLGGGSGHESDCFYLTGMTQRELDEMNESDQEPYWLFDT